jgi:hypothetical protein
LAEDLVELAAGDRLGERGEDRAGIRASCLFGRVQITGQPAQELVDAG